MEAVELSFQVSIDPHLPPVVEGAVSFETGASRAQVSDPKLFAYEHHGEGFGPNDPGALTRFFEDLILGTPFPLVFATHRVGGLDTILATALFLHRDLATHPGMPGLVAAADLVHRRGHPFLGHVEPDLARFFQGLEGYFTGSFSKKELGEKLTLAVQWVREYVLEGRLPDIGPRPQPIRVLDVGTNGFVLAATDRPSIEAWVDLYRQGFLRGVLVGPDEGDFRQVVASHKSERVTFDLGKALLHLNELEVLSGGDAEWSLDGLYLFGPPIGTTILVGHLLEVLLRV
jgi:hypothetical protein